MHRFLFLFCLTSCPFVANTTPAADDPIRQLQIEAEISGRADWGHWGDQPGKYVTWSNHSNRLIPVYAFGTDLKRVRGVNSPYRHADRLEALYGRLPDDTLNPEADYFDQTDVYDLQLQAAEAGAKRIVLVVFDGLDWHTTRAAAVAAKGQVPYSEGRGDVFAFQQYRGTTTDFGWCVTSPANKGTEFDVDAQLVITPGGATPGGYDARRGGTTPWDRRADSRYLIGKDRDCPHAVVDSAASATAMCSGKKTFNKAINVDPAGQPLTPLGISLQQRGYAVGVVTSVPISHATPACAYACNVSRDDYQDLTRDLLGEPSISRRTPPGPGLDVLIGTGHGKHTKADGQQGQNFEPGNKYLADSTLRAIDATSGGRYQVVTRTPGRRGAEVLAEAAATALEHGRSLFGFFGTADGHLPFQTACGDSNPVGGRIAAGMADELRKKYAPLTPYTEADLTENPTLAEMTTTALDLLSSGDRPFWLLIEAGDVDWASHANNIDTAIGAVKSGDAAVAALFAWIEAHGGWDDTVVIVTADHGHMFTLDDPQAFAAAAAGTASKPAP
jgi:alkaline phosphatase